MLDVSLVFDSKVSKPIDLFDKAAHRKVAEGLKRKYLNPRPLPSTMLWYYYMTLKEALFLSFEAVCLTGWKVGQLLVRELAARSLHLSQGRITLTQMILGRRVSIECIESISGLPTLIEERGEMWQKCSFAMSSRDIFFWKIITWQTVICIGAFHKKIHFYFQHCWNSKEACQLGAHRHFLFRPPPNILEI